MGAKERVPPAFGLRRPAKPRKGVGAGPSNPAWRGGRRTRGDGYVVLWTPERPILFSGPMVNAILAGRKSQTRRIIKPQPVDLGAALLHLPCPHGAPGDRLWCREKWRSIGRCIEYAADHATKTAEQAEPLSYDQRWRPSIHMPRWASRITLEITEVRVERLQDISEEDAKAEGCVEEAPPGFANRYGDGARSVFAALWDSIHGPGAWDLNPWCWAISFRRLP